MKYIARSSLMFLSLVILLSLSVVGWAADSKCDNRAPRVRAVKLDAPIFNTVDFSGSNGAFDPTPLLETKIYVGGKKTSCVIAHFGAQVSTGDNLIVFQASIDDDPMEGHSLLPVDIRSPQLTTPIVIDRGTVFSANLPDINVPTLATYNFFKIVKPGWHTVKIKWAGCCSADPSSVSAETLAAVLTLEYQGKFAHYEHDDD